MATAAFLTACTALGCCSPATQPHTNQAAGKDSRSCCSVGPPLCTICQVESAVCCHACPVFLSALSGCLYSTCKVQSSQAIDQVSVADLGPRETSFNEQYVGVPDHSVIHGSLSEASSRLLYSRLLVQQTTVHVNVLVHIKFGLHLTAGFEQLVTKLVRMCIPEWAVLR